MNWLRRKITELQNKSYEKRLRILKGAVIAIAFFLILIWVLSLRYSNHKNPNNFSGFEPVLENLKNFKQLKPSN